MTRNTFSRWTAVVAIAVMCMAFASVASAQTVYTWALTGPDGNWNDPGAWTSGIPSVAGDVATFLEPNLLTVSLNNQAWTVGGVQFLGDSANYTITGGGASGQLIISDPNGMGYIYSQSTSGLVTFNAAVQLNVDTLVRSAFTVPNGEGDPSMDFRGVVSGTGRIFLQSPGGAGNNIVYLSNRNNTFSGGVDIGTNGWIVLNGTGTGGTGAIYANPRYVPDIGYNAGGYLSLQANDEANAVFGNDLYGVPYLTTFEMGKSWGGSVGSPGTWGYQMGNWYPFYRLPTGVVNAHVKTDGYYTLGDANHVGHPLVFKSTNLVGGGILYVGLTYNFFNLGKITGDGSVHVGDDAGSGRGYGGGVIMSDTTSDWAGGVTVSENAALILTGANVTGSGAVTLGSAGTPGYFSSSATTNAAADHSAVNVIVNASSAIDGRQGGLWNFYINSTNDPNVIVHKFGNLTFGAGNAGLDVGWGPWIGHTSCDETDQIWIQGTVTLNGLNPIAPHQRTVINGKVTGGSLSVNAGNNNFYPIGNNALVLTNNQNDYADTTIGVNAVLMATQPQALGTGTVFLNNGVLISVATDNASADRSLTNVNLFPTGTGGQIIGQQSQTVTTNAQQDPAFPSDPNFTVRYQTVMGYYGNAGIDDGNVITHKFGTLNYMAAGQTFTAGEWNATNDVIEFTGGATLNGLSALIPNQKIVLSGPVTGPGILRAAHTPNFGTMGVWLTNNSSDYSGGTQIDTGTFVAASGGANTLGTGPVFLNGGTLYSLANSNADAYRPGTNITVTGAYVPFNPGGALQPGLAYGRGIDTSGNVWDGFGSADANIAPVVNHVFGDLTFAVAGSTFNSGMYPASHDTAQFMGTVTLNGNSTIYLWNKTTLSGQVTGAGNLVISGMYQPNGALWLTGNNNDYADTIINTAISAFNGSTEIGELVITAPHALGNGNLILNGGTLYDYADNDANANHSYVNTIVRASSQIRMGSSVGGAPGNATVGVMHRFGNLTFDSTAPMTLSIGGNRPDTMVFGGTTMLNGPDTIKDGATTGAGSMIELTGKVTGDGILIQAGLAQGDGGSNSGGFVLSNTSNDYTGGTYVYGRFALAGANVTGTGPVYLEPGVSLFSLVASNADADHSATNLDLLGSATILTGQGWTGNNLNSRVTNDPNVIIHKFGDVTFGAPNLTLSVSREGTDQVWFQGTVTLNGSDTFSTPYANVNGGYPGQFVRLNGKVTGGNIAFSGTLNTWAGTSEFWLTNNSNDYGDTTMVAGNGNSRLVVTAPNALGTGTVYLAGGTLVSLAENDANANHSANNIMVTSNFYGYGLVGDGSTAFPGGGSKPPALVGVRTDVNGGYATNANWVTHRFGNLGFTGTGYTLFVSDWNTGNDVIEFDGTTSLNGRTYLATWREQITLAGPVVDGANAGQLVTPSANGGQGVWLMNNNNTYSGGTEIQGNAATDGTYVTFVVALAPHALGTGPVALNNGRLYSVAWDDANADHSGNNVQVLAGGGNITATKNLINSHPGITFTDYADDANIARVTHKFGNLTFAAQGLTIGTGGWGGAPMKTSPNDLVKFVGTTTLNGVTHFYPYQPLELAGLVTGDATNGGSLNVSAVGSGRGMVVSHNNNDYAGGTFIFGGTLSVTGTNGLGTGNIVSQVGSVLNLLGTNSVDNASINVTNDGLLHVGAGASSLVGDVVPSAALAGTVQLDAGSALSVHKVVQNAVSVGAAATLTVRGGSATTNVLNNLTIAGATNAWTGTVDTRQNYLVVNNGNLATMTNQIASGLNPNGNLWTGTGITSSVAASDGNGATALGIARASDLGLAGQPLTALIPDADPVTLSASSVIVRQTLFGDADMNGTVDADLDLTQWFAGFANYQNLAVDPNLFDPNITGWLYGDFNYDGVVDADLDLTQWFAGFAVSQNQAAAPGAPGAVPEPATLVLLGLGAVSLLTRRNRKA